MATILATKDYVLFSGDTTWLRTYWDKYKLAMGFVTAKVDDTGLMNVTGANNWGRTAISNGYTTDGNMLLYGCLTSGATMAKWMNDSVGVQWMKLANGIAAAIIETNWDSSTGCAVNVQN